MEIFVDPEDMVPPRLRHGASPRWTRRDKSANNFTIRSGDILVNIISDLGV